MTIGYKIDYTRNTYSRGKMQNRDMVLEAVISPSCQFCGKPISRPLNIYGRPLRIRDWLKKKTCSTKCLLGWRKKPENFPKMIKEIYQGLAEKNKCHGCGKSLCYYNKVRQAGRRFLCQPCYQKWKMTMDGQYAVSKFLTCTITGCSEPHEAKVLCRRHYQNSKSHNHHIGRPRGSKNKKIK
jgi:hypothetical protein